MVIFTYAVDQLLFNIGFLTSAAKSVKMCLTTCPLISYLAITLKTDQVAHPAGYF